MNTMTADPADAAADATARRTADTARVALFGVEFTPLTIEQAARLIVGRPAIRPFDYVVTPNAAHIVHISRDPALAPIWNEAFLTLLDSSITQLGGNFFGRRIPLTTGSDLTAYLFDHGLIAVDEPITVIGCTPGAIEQLRIRYGLRQVLHYNPPMGFIHDECEVRAVIDFVAAAPSRLHFFAVGAPQSEIVARRLRDERRATGLGLCVGASLNFLAGVERRAPCWMRRHRLEWVYRFWRQPRRIGRRILFEGPPMVAIVAREMLRRLLHRAARHAGLEHR
jgi:N-acetylglucosaminyldiphosphoundecaprenol N-acetyl-beta-D-mannosaminyltransferase